MSVIAAADFLTTEVWARRELILYYTFFVIRLDTREVRIAHIGCQLNGQVMAQITDHDAGEHAFLIRREHLNILHSATFTEGSRHYFKSTSYTITKEQDIATSPAQLLDLTEPEPEPEKAENPTVVCNVSA